jgi:DNA polymerase-1
MSEGLRLVFGDAERKYGAVKVLVRAMRGESTIFADTARLDRTDDRAEIAEQIVACAATVGISANKAEIESALLDELDRALAALSARDDELASGEGGGRGASQADLLVEIGRAAELFHDPQGVTYARLNIGGHVETWATKSTGFRRWLAREFFTRHQKAPNGEALQSARTILEGFAQFEGPTRPVYLRVAPDGLGGIVIDLGDPEWTAVHVTPGGWAVVSDMTVAFRRAAGMLPLPRPVGGGKLDDLREFVNVRDDAGWARIKAWLRAAARDRGPYPVLALYGEQGSAKTTTARLLRSVIDPAKPFLRSDPRDVRDLMIAANACHVVGLDNLSSLAPWISDALCRLSTGGGWATRELTTDTDEVLFEAMRPVTMTGINEFITRGDLLDRALPEVLATIGEEHRRSEEEILAAFEEASPRLLGALLDDVAAGLRVLPETRLARLPRMADFARWSVAVERGCGERPTFLAAFQQAREESHHQAVEAHSVGAALLAVLEDIVALEGVFSDSAEVLLDRVNERADDAAKKARDFPKSARGMSGVLRRLAPALRGLGYRVEFPEKRDPGTGKRRLLLGRAEKISAAGADEAGAGPSQPSQDHEGAADQERGRSTERDGRTTGTAPDAEPFVTDEPPGVTVDQDNVTIGDDLRDGPTSERDGCDDVPSAGSAGGKKRNLPDDVIVVGDAVTARAAVAELMIAPVLGLDVETTGLDPRVHRVRLVQISTGDLTYVFDLFRIDRAVLTPVLAAQDGPRLVGHNLKFDLSMLWAAGLQAASGHRLFDTMLAARLLEAGDGDSKARGRFTLASVAQRYVQVELDKTEQVSDWSGALTDAQIQYAARDAAVLPRLAATLDRDLGIARLVETAALEMRVLPALVWLEMTGAPFDVESWVPLAEAAVRRTVEITARLDAFIGPRDLFGGSGINWNSPAQVKRVLSERGHEVSRVDEEALTVLAGRDELAAVLLEYREASKRTGTYGIEFLKHVHQATGRIHADYHQIGADSGRMSCSRPNLMQIPRDPAYRACFRPPAGRVLVKADYSQIELRIAAELAGDERLMEAFADGVDVHALTAAAVVGGELGAVTKQARSAAKALNFGLVYGMGATTLQGHARTQYGVTLSDDEAVAFRARFFETYRGILRWHRRQPGGTVTTVTTVGRRRRNVSSFMQKLNTPVQGAGADGAKNALALLWETRERCPSATPVLFVHDEIVIEVDVDEAEMASDWLVDCMTRGMQQFLQKVPVVVETSIARDWSGSPLVTEQVDAA